MELTNMVQVPISSNMSLHGITQGMVSISATRRLRVGIWIDSCPSWVFALSGLGVQICFLCVDSNAATFEAVGGVVATEKMMWGQPTLTLLRGIDLLLVDVMLSPTLLRHFSSTPLQFILLTKHLRKCPQQWHRRFWRIAHNHVGGVTDATGTITLLSRCPAPQHVATSTFHQPMRTLNSILDDKLSSRKHHKLPHTNSITSPQITYVPNLQHLQRQVLHPGGLVPFRHISEQCVLAPSVYAPKGLSAIRQLSVREVLRALDFPDFVPPATIVATNTLPGKIFLSVLRYFVTVHEGGDFFFNFNTASDIIATSTFNSSTADSTQDASFDWSQAINESNDADDDDDMTVDTSNTFSKKRFATAIIAPIPKRRQHDDVTSFFVDPATLYSATQDNANIQAQIKHSVKADDAELPTHLWLEYMISKRENADIDYTSTSFLVIANWLRKYMLKRWLRNIRSSFRKWMYSMRPRIRQPVHALVNWTCHKSQWKATWTMQGQQEYSRWHTSVRKYCWEEFQAAQESIQRARRASWWKWNDGSRPFFWRWPLEYQDIIRKGLPVHFHSVSPSNRRPQRGVDNQETRAKMQEKLDTVRSRRYITPGPVNSLTSFFSVPKGEDDVRMVYDATASGLNDSIWVPSFSLPTINTHLRGVNHNTYMADNDIGEMFLNFTLHESMQKLCGVDLTLYCNQDEVTKSGVVWERWNRAAMGLKSSPYQAVQAMLFAEEVIRGNPTDATNIFRWHSVVLNLPGSKDYDPSLPWVAKVRMEGTLASDFYIYVDDVRTTGISNHECWEASQRISKGLGFLGVQDAVRKRRPPKRKPGPWVGAIVVAHESGIYVSVTESKWLKGRKLVDEVQGLLASSEGRKGPNGRKLMNRKHLEQVRGFLNYICQTYCPMTPYLIGFHLTIDGWRTGRDDDGWRIPHHHVFGSTETLADVPDHVEATARLTSDIAAMQAFFALEQPPLRRVRARRTFHAWYGFGDASPGGFGATIDVLDEGVSYRYGEWCAQIVEETSMNWKELKNLVASLKEWVHRFKIEGTEVFMFTDNMTAESAFWKGNSSSKMLAALVLEMRMMEMEANLILHVVHVSGDRMVQQGTDGLSRADHSTGVMAGTTMREHIPLHLSPLQRNRNAIISWMPQIWWKLKYEILEPCGWYTTGHTEGNFVWEVAPAAAEVVTEQLGTARHKRPQSMHMVMVPRLMTGRWRRRLIRMSDMYFTVCNCEMWPAHLFEPLVVFVFLPYRSWCPRLEERRKLVEESKGILLQKELWKTHPQRCRSILCQLLQSARALCPL
mmetsp:Transcript_17572/g.49639  ORF Transcript_17572/g.49639 Transcript_17572/m.49639 type:complete len:1287 (+) Transcript_17572:10428-14288(+)